MAPTRSTPNPEPRARINPYPTRSKGLSGTELPITSPNSESNHTHDINDDEDDHQVEDGYILTNGTREKCTNEQSEALEALFWRALGFPTRIEKEEIAAQIGKSYHSTNVWMQNRRHPRDPARKPWFLVPGAINPAIDPTAPLYPLAGITPKSLNKTVKRPIKSLASKRKAPSKVTRKVTRTPTSISTPVDPSDLPLDDVSMRDSAPPGSPNSSGDSNGSAVSTPRISPSVEVQEETPPILTSDDLKNEVAVILVTMRSAFISKGKVLELTQYVRPIAASYPESSVRLWSAPDNEVATQARLPLLHPAVPLPRLVPACGGHLAGSL